ncbi:MAG: hypothetical protein HOC57_10920, partial [Rhodospirillaceae bacterium]|nr:hypothetical protein [Rhodospirillaceae bacterium]
TLEKAAAINPASGDVRQMLGSLHLQLGDADKARENLTETVRLNPDNSKAFYEMSQLPGVDLTSQQLEHLREMVSREDLSEASKSEAAYTLARCAEKIKDYAGAFANLATANKLRLSLLENFGYTFDASAQAIEIQKTIDFFTAEFLAAQTRDESSAAPVFIIGLPRSGTTLIERIISSHTEAAGLGELTEIEKIVSTLKSQNPAYPECLSDIKTDELRQLGGGYLSFLQDKAPGARRIVDKNPFNFIHLGLIKSLFPKAAIIYCRRDLRDVGLSCFMQNFVDPLPWSNDLELMGQYFNQFGKLMDHWQQVLGEEILTLDYEKVVVDFESHARSIISHIGLAWDEKCLAFHEADGGVQTASTVQVREPIYQRSVGRWRNYEAQLNPLIEILD